MSQTEPTFPDSLRIKYLEKPLREYSLASLKFFNNENTNCSKLECPEKLRPTPKGSIPGLW